jgi:hypothetical protein
LIALSAGVSIVFLSLLLANPQSTTTAWWHWRTTL